MTSKTNRTHADAAWPQQGYITVPQMREALGGCSDQTLYNYRADKLLPDPVWIGPNRRGWSVDVARQALADLPSKIAARKKRPQGFAATKAARVAI